MSRMLTSPT